MRTEEHLTWSAIPCWRMASCVRETIRLDFSQVHRLAKSMVALTKKEIGRLVYVELLAPTTNSKIEAFAISRLKGFGDLGTSYS